MRSRAWDLLARGWVALSLTAALSCLASPGSASVREVAAAGVVFRWSVEGGALRGCMEAATRGWIAVGFNTEPRLEGSRLVMGRVVAGRALAEVHQAAPPWHHRRQAADGSDLVHDVSGVQRDGRTTVCFTMPLMASYSGDVELGQGRDVMLTMAWSHEPDLQHHSAQRAAVRVRL